MSKDDRKILRAVRVDNRTITDPDELLKEATPEQLADLQTRGYLSGTWGKTAAGSTSEDGSASPKGGRKEKK